MIDMSRISKNLVFFTLGLILSFLIFIPFAEAATWSNVGSSFYAYKNWTVLVYGSIVTMTASDPAFSLKTQHTSPQGDVSIANTYTTGSGTAKTYQIFDVGNNYNDTMDVLQWRVSTDYVPPDPESWTNGVKDADEDGIDCGGDNPTVCEITCTGDKILFDMGGVSVCMYSIPQDSMGDCPSNYYPDAGVCLEADSLEMPVLAAPTVGSLPATDSPSDNPWNESTINTDTDIVRSSSVDGDGTVHDVESTTTTKTDTNGDSETFVTTVDTATHPDGTSTITTTTSTTTNGSGVSDSTTSTGVNTKTYDSDGNLISESDTETTTEADPEKDEDNPSTAPSTDGLSSEVSDIDLNPLIDSLEVTAGKWPFNVPYTMIGFYQMFDVEPIAPKFDLVLVGHTFQVDLSIFDTVAMVLRFLLGTLVTLGLFYYIMHFYRGVS